MPTAFDALLMLAFRQGCVKHRESNKLRSVESQSNKMSSMIPWKHVWLDFSHLVNEQLTQLTHTFKHSWHSWLIWLFSKCLEVSETGTKLQQLNQIHFRRFRRPPSIANGPSLHLQCPRVSVPTCCLLTILTSTFWSLRSQEIKCTSGEQFLCKKDQKSRPIKGKTSGLSLPRFYFNQAWYHAFYHHINVKCCPVRIAALMLAYIAFFRLIPWKILKVWTLLNSEVSVSKCFTEDVSLKTVRKKSGNIPRWALAHPRPRSCCWPWLMDRFSIRQLRNVSAG